MQLTDKQVIFVGFKMDGSLRHQLGALEGPDRQYVSYDDRAFLTICTHEKDQYVGKVVEGRLTTEHVDDVRRNVLSIVGRLCPEVRLPQNLEIWVCAAPADSAGLPQFADSALD